MDNDASVKCHTCDRIQEVNLAQCLRTRWPKCCGSTMWLDRTPPPEQIEAAISQMMEAH